jgi:hypothetical protein
MQVANKPLYEIETVDLYLKRAQHLVHFIDTSSKAADSEAFQSVVFSYKESFPQTYAAFNAFATLLHMLDSESRLELKLTLLSDLKKCVSKAMDDLLQPKMLLAVPLPADPDECLARMETMMREGQAQINAIRQTFQCIAHARTVVHRMRENKRQLELLDESVFTAAPVVKEVTKRSVKKAKNE